MKLKSLFVSAQELNTGLLFVSMGMMEILKRNLHRVAFFRPIIVDSKIVDHDISFMKERYNLNMNYEDMYGFDVAYVEEMIASNRVSELIKELLVKFKKLENSYDFVLCEGVRLSFLNANINFDINIKLAKNFGSSYINVINAKEDSAKEVFESIEIESETLDSEGCKHFATIVNRLEPEKHKQLQKSLEHYPFTTYLLPENEELNSITIEDVIDSLGAESLFLSKEDHTRTIRKIKIASLGVDNFLEKIEEDDLIVVAGDRSDIILGLLGALYSEAYPNISCIVFPFHMQADPNIEKLIKGLSSFSIPILSVPTDTYETAQALSRVRSYIRVSSQRKIALFLGLFNSGVDTNFIQEKIATTENDIMTPIMFEYKLFDMASAKRETIVLPESSDERILRAVEVVLHRGFADIILIGDESEVREHSLRLGLDLSNATIINHKKSKLLEIFIERFYEMRRAKGLTREAATDAMLHENYFATMMVELGYADGMVSGAIHSTGDTIRPALQIIKTTADVSVVSSVFLMCMPTKVLVYGDCAVNPDPDVKMLADIAIASSQTALAFGIEPKVAMLSYSTGESGSGTDVDKVREATEIVKSRDSELLIEGPIQYDAAVNAEVAKKKLPHSKVAGDATVFIFPDLNTGNNTYKAVQRSSGAVAIGPILQGLNKPVNDLSRGCLISDIVNTIAITAIQAGSKQC